MANPFSISKITKITTILSWIILGPICRAVVSFYSVPAASSALIKVNTYFGTKFYISATYKILIPILVFFLIKSIYPVIVTFLIKLIAGIFVITAGIKIFKFGLATGLNLKEDQINYILIILGAIIALILLNYLKALFFKKKNVFSIEDIDSLGGTDKKRGGFLFESYISGLYSRMGFFSETVTELKEKGILKTKGFDQGADVVLEYFEGNERRRAIVQCKLYSGKVGNEAIQQVVAALAFYGANKAIVVTNSFFTDAAIELARANNVNLVDRLELIKLIELDNSPRLVQLLEKIKLMGS